jgi:hypothetical protein
MKSFKRYLGDGVFADISQFGEVVLTTENGINVTNTIVMEPEVIQAFKEFLHEVGIK